MDMPRPEPLSPAQQRAARARKNQVIREGQAKHLLPATPPTPRPVPARKRFDLADVKRIPVDVTPAAHERIHASTQQGRLFPQALSEHFGAAGNVARMHVDVQPKSRYFPIGTDERDPVTGGEPVLLVITATHANHPDVPEHVWYLNAADLCDLHPRTHEPLFQAVPAAQELHRLYPHRDVPVAPVSRNVPRRRKQKGA